MSDNDDDIEPSDLTIIASLSASDKDVDTTVEQTCEKINLTASNVRNIIRVSVRFTSLNVLPGQSTNLSLTCCVVVMLP